VLFVRLRKPWIAALFELRYGVIGHGVSLSVSPSFKPRTTLRARLSANAIA
jgi:hypothetical protein